MRDINDCNNRVTLYERTVTTADGSSTEALQLIGSYWASVYCGSDKEFETHGVVWTKRPIVVQMRKPAKELNSGLLVAWRGETYEADSVQPAEKAGFIKIKATLYGHEGVGTGA